MWRCTVPIIIASIIVALLIVSQILSHSKPSEYCSVQFSHSVMSDSLRPHESQHARPPCPLPTLELIQTPVHWVGDVFQPFHPLFPLLLLPSIFPSIRVFSSELALCIRWPKSWSFSFCIRSEERRVGKDNSADLNILKRKKNPGKAGKSYDECIIGQWGASQNFSDRPIYR